MSFSFSQSQLYNTRQKGQNRFTTQLLLHFIILLQPYHSDASEDMLGVIWV